MSITDRFLLEFEEGLAAVPENDTNIALVQPRPGPNLHVSPDEAVIQARGRRRMPASFSPEREIIFQESCSSGSNAPIKTRVFGQPSRKKPLSRLSLVTQDTMRRRLDFAVDEDCVTVSRLPFVVKDGVREDEEIEIRQAEKKLKRSTVTVNNNVVSAKNPLAAAKALSREQLLRLVSDLSLDDPGRRRLGSLMPRPDISSRVSGLTYHMQNLHRALPYTSLARSMETHVSSRTKVHWTVFRKVLTDDLGELVESEIWDTVIEYIMAAWEVVDMTPVCEENVNSTRNCCFKLLALAVRKVTKQKEIDPITKRKLVEMMTTSTVRDVEVCRDSLSQSLSMTPK